MPRLTPVHWKVLECIFQAAGFVFKRQGATDHRIYTRPATARPIVIPTKKEVDVEIIKSNMRTVGMSREEYFKLWEQCK